jgi:hypothetical protein
MPSRSPMTAPVLWLALLALGQAALFEFTYAGNTIHYQHLVIDQWGAHLPAIGMLVVQAIAVIVGLARVGVPLAPARLLVLLIVIVALSAAPSHDLGFYATELAVAGAVACVQLGNLWLASASLPCNWTLRIPAWALASAVAITAAVLNLTIYENHPHIADELAFLLQGRMYAQGLIAVAPPPVPAAFEIDLFVRSATEWFSCTLPGYPLLLALGHLVGAPWLVNALLAGLNVLLGQRLFLRILSPAAASLATLLLAASPWNLFLAMSYMSHTAGLTFLLLMLLPLTAFFARGGLHRLLLSGLALGALFATRMLDATAIAAAAGLYLLIRTRRLAPAAAFTAGFLVLASAMLAYNARLTGSPSYTTLNYYFDTVYRPRVNRLGFGPDVGLAWAFDPYPGHSLADAAVNTALNLFQLNTELYGWAGGSLALLVGCLLTRRWERADSALLALAAFLPAVYSLYWFSGGPDFGARYWHLILVPLIIWTARVLDQQAMTATATVAMLVATALFIPWRASDKYRGYLQMGPELRDVRFDAQGPAIVFVRGRRHPDYASASYYNRLDFQGPIVFAWDRDPATRAAVLAAYPGRKVFTVEGPTITGGGYRILSSQAGNQ